VDTFGKVDQSVKKSHIKVLRKKNMVDALIGFILYGYL